MRYKGLIVSAFLMAVVAACSSLTLKPADYSWPIENAIKANNKGVIEEQRYSFSVNINPLFFLEFQDSTNVAGKEVRVIRDRAGYYFITGKGFKNVYVFKTIESGMELENTILISESKLNAPAFNQKAPNIELLDSSNKYLLNKKGLVR